MTGTGPIRIEADGTRVYAKGHRYKPMADADRTNKVRKPADPGAVRHYGNWYLPLPLLPDDARILPETVPDEETLSHRAACRCHVCRRPAAKELWSSRWRRKNRLQPVRSRR